MGAAAGGNAAAARQRTRSMKGAPTAALWQHKWPNQGRQHNACYNQRTASSASRCKAFYRRSREEDFMLGQVDARPDHVTRPAVQPAKGSTSR